jgi:hypothetical protein
MDRGAGASGAHHKPAVGGPPPLAGQPHQVFGEHGGHCMCTCDVRVCVGACVCGCVCLCVQGVCGC